MSFLPKRIFIRNVHSDLGLSAGARTLFLALSSGITPGGAQETKCSARIKAGFDTCKASALSLYHCPLLFFFLIVGCVGALHL